MIQEIKQTIFKFKYWFIGLFVAGTSVGLMWPLGAVRPISLVIDARNETQSVNDVIAVFPLSFKGRAYCIVSEETSLPVKRHLFDRCEMRIVPKGKTIEQLRADADSFLIEKGEQSLVNKIEVK